MRGQVQPLEEVAVVFEYTGLLCRDVCAVLLLPLRVVLAAAPQAPRPPCVDAARGREGQLHASDVADPFHHVHIYCTARRDFAEFLE